MIELRTPSELQQMLPAGRFVASVLATLRDEVAVGTNLLEIDARAHDLIRQAGAESCYIDYHPSFGASPFGKVICTSVNDAVLHGLPHDYALQDGDLLSVDFAASVDGWVADSALSGGPFAVRRTRAGDAWQARQSGHDEHAGGGHGGWDSCGTGAAPGPVSLGMPTLSVR